MKWKAILNLVFWLVNKIATDEDGNGIPDILEFSNKKIKEYKNG